ncbi:MAG: universal stress protein UspA [Comamonadaceae bacterium]|nr:universal stress protein UspA [Comamonadaceae bacterium]
MKILVAVDGSEASLHAVRHALHLARAGLRADIVLATVQQPTFFYEMVLAPDADVLERLSGAVGGRALAPAQALLDAAGVPYTHEIGSGEVAPTLVEIAESQGCDAIVIGARGLGAVRGALLGSVSQGVLHRARVPVTIVKDEVAS